MQPEPEPEEDWAQHALRVLDLIDNQVRSLRKRQVVDAFKRGQRQGAYWGIRTNIRDYQLPTALDCPFDRTTELANTPTRLQRMDDDRQERLVRGARCRAAPPRRRAIPAYGIASTVGV
jgi:NTE family protein